jgi:hypothetical protein
MMAMESTIFTGWIYDYLLLHAEKVKVAHPLMPKCSRKRFAHATRATLACWHTVDM